jgi:hypothetical protein
MTTYQALEQQTQQMCDTIANDPQARGQVRKVFYQHYGFCEQDGLSYGNSEIDFYDYERKRGVINPLSDMPPGSHWWRNVNLKFIYFSELAGAMYAAGISEEQAPNPVKKWLEFIKEPSPQTWYRAHNSSIMTAAFIYGDNAAQENEVEQLFLNIILYRLMFSQAMVEDATFFGDIGEFLADPRGFAVDLIVHMANFYPLKYPLEPQDRAMILGDVNAIKTEMQSDFVDHLKSVKDTVEDKLKAVHDDFEVIKHRWFGKAAKAQDSSIQTGDVRQEDDFDPNILTLIEAEQVNILDNKIILPNLTRLYQAVAKWNDIPFVVDFQKDGKPVYPVAND